MQQQPPNNKDIHGNPNLMNPHDVQNRQRYSQRPQQPHGKAQFMDSVTTKPNGDLIYTLLVKAQEL
jgi:hypothetical protein